MDDRLLTILQTARQFNLTTGLLYTAVARGELAAIRFRPRGRIRIRETDVLGWIEGHASGARRDLQRPVRPPERPSPGASDIEQFLPPKELRRFAG
jgi:excisionase family DNA binding protein